MIVVVFVLFGVIIGVLGIGKMCMFIECVVYFFEEE